LVLNCGGATLKYKLFRMPGEGVLGQGMLDRIASPRATLTHRKEGRGEQVFPLPEADHHAGIEKVLEILADAELGLVSSLSEISAVAHKLPHGGLRFRKSVLVDGEVIGALEECSPMAPLHNPPSLKAILVCRELLPGVPQVGVFETSFHTTVPEYASVYGLPREWLERHSVRKFGFHSTSHRHVLSWTARLLGRPKEELNIISCHLGSGTSVCAIKAGKSLDISSGFSPQAGTLMSTRHGDFDPAVVPYMMRRLGIGPDEMDEILTRESGLLGISGLSGDMRDLQEAAAEGHGGAKLAIEAFVYSVRKYVGQYLVLLGDVDALAFTGGIGESSASIRREVCAGMDRFGIALDEGKNEALRGGGVISEEDSPTQVVVIPTDEEIVVARDAMAILERIPEEA